MNKEEIREYIFAKRKPISHCVDLTRYFIGRHKTLPIFLTPAFEMEFNRSMQELEILREQVKKQKEVIDKVKELITDNIEETTYEYISSTRIKVLQRLIMDNNDVNELLDILKEVE